MISAIWSLSRPRKRLAVIRTVADMTEAITACCRVRIFT